MSWTDEEIDNMFQESATAQSFEYDNAYFSEIEAALPVNKSGRDFLWLGTAVLFIAVLTTGYFVGNSTDTLNSSTNQLAIADIKNENAEPSKNSVSQSATEVNGNQNLNQTSSVSTTTTQSENVQMSLITKKSFSDQENADPFVRSTARNVKESGTKTGTVEKGQEVSKEIRTSPIFAEANALRSNEVVMKDRNGAIVPITAVLNPKSVTQLDQNIDHQLAPNMLPSLNELRPKSAFYVELNSGLSQSFLQSSNQLSNSIGAGLGIESYLGRFNLTTGLNFKAANHLELNATYSGRSYGFGSNDNMVTYDYRQLYSFELPISLGLNAGNHNFNIGVRPSILLGAKFNEEKFENKELKRSEQIYGMTDALKRIGLKPSLGYAYRFNKWIVGGTIGVQVMQTVNEDYLGLNTRLPIDGKIYLRRTIRLR